jgi:hypothetical protein
VASIMSQQPLPAADPGKVWFLGTEEYICVPTRARAKLVEMHPHIPQVDPHGLDLPHSHEDDRACAGMPLSLCLPVSLSLCLNLHSGSLSLPVSARSDFFWRVHSLWRARALSL